MTSKPDADNLQKADQPGSPNANTEHGMDRPGETETDSAHMGASESQVVPTTPPTEALDKLLHESAPVADDTQTVDDQFTPG